MRTMTITKTVYKFEELPEDVQEKVVENFGNDTSYFWEGENRDTLMAFEKVFPVKVRNWEYGYRNFINFDSLVDDEVKGFTGVRLMKYIINHYYDDLFKPKYLGYVKGKARRSRIQRENSCVLTGYCLDDDILRPIYDFLKKPDKSNTFDDILSDCLHSWISACNKDYEYRQSREAIVGEIAANDYEFDEKGNIV
jgi:hypothetical protein